MKIIAYTFIAALLIFSSCDSKKVEGEKTDQISTTGQYTCPMHPEVVSDKAGACPKCGMDLEKKAEGEKAASDTTMKM